MFSSYWVNINHGHDRGGVLPNQYRRERVFWSFMIQSLFGGSATTCSHGASSAPCTAQPQPQPGKKWLNNYLRSRSFDPRSISYIPVLVLLILEHKTWTACISIGWDWRKGNAVPPVPPLFSTMKILRLALMILSCVHINNQFLVIITWGFGDDSSDGDPGTVERVEKKEEKKKQEEV